MENAGNAMFLVEVKMGDGDDEDTASQTREDREGCSYWAGEAEGETIVVDVDIHRFFCHYCRRSRRSLGLLRTHMKKRHRSLLGLPPEERGEKPPEIPAKKDYLPTMKQGRRPPGRPPVVKILSANSTIIRTSGCRKARRAQFCPYCDYVAGNTANLSRHVMSRHTKERPYACAECAYASVTKYDLRKHVEFKHRQERTHTCPHCDYTGFNLSHVKRHVRRKHGSQRCPFCDYVAAEAETMRQHILGKHAQTGHRCTFCNYSSPSLEDVRSHMIERHMKERPHVCPHCDHGAMDPSSLKRHIASKHKELFEENNRSETVVL